MKESIITITAMFLIAVLEIIAIVNEINGALLSTSIVAIAGLGGYYFRKSREKK